MPVGRPQRKKGVIPMVTMTQPRTIHPVMPPVNHSFADKHYSVFGDGPSTVERKAEGLTLSGGIASLLKAFSTATRFITLSILGFMLLLIPGIAGGVAYHVASNNSSITVVRTQYVPENTAGQGATSSPSNPETMVRSAEN